MTALAVDLLQVLRLPVDLVHGPREPVLVLLVLRVLRVRVVARPHQTVLVRVLLPRHDRVLLVDAVAVRMLLSFLRMPRNRTLLMLHGV